MISVPRGIMASSVFVKLKTVTCWAAYNSTDYNTVTELCDALNLAAGLNASVWAETPQPTGFDQWANMYQRYTVLASKVCLVIVSQYSSNTLATSVSLMATTESAAAVQTAMGTTTGRSQGPLSMPWVRTVTPGALSSGASVKKIKMYCKTKSQYPAEDITDDPDFTGTTVTFTSGQSAPINNLYYHMIVTQNSNTIAANFAYRIILTQWVKLSSPNVLANS